MSQTLDLAGGNYCTTKAGLSAGTTSTLTTANTVQYAIAGKAQSKAAITNQATPTSDATSAALFTARPVLPNQGSVFLVGFNAAGTLLASQGDIKALDVQGNFIDAPQFPTFPDGPAGAAPFGYILIKAGSTASASGWIFGTSNMASVTGITYTFVDILDLPSRPQVS